MSQLSPDMTLQPFEGINVGDSLRVTIGGIGGCSVRFS